MRLIREIEGGIEVSEGNGWRPPYAGEFVATEDGSGFLNLNAESTAVAWWQGFGSGLLAAMAGLAAIAVFVVERGA